MRSRRWGRVPPTVAAGERVKLSEPVRGDVAALVAGAVASRRLHHPWVFPPTDETAVEAWIERTHRDDLAAHLAWSDGELCAVVNVNNIVRGALRSGSLGYYGFVGSSGRGLVAEAVGLVVERSFADLGLHRLEANIQPTNLRSRRVVEQLGFRLEGYSPRYLHIDGDWRDHERWAITVDDERADRRPG